MRACYAPGAGTMGFDKCAEKTTNHAAERRRRSAARRSGVPGRSGARTSMLGLLTADAAAPYLPLAPLHMAVGGRVDGFRHGRLRANDAVKRGAK
jgi:hypothetical protein